jgi:hypothetical protein
MNLLKLTVANGSEKGGSLYVSKDKICGFTPIICRLGSDYGKEKGTNILLDTGFAYMVEESVKDICKMLESSNGYLQITSIPDKNKIYNETMA